MVDRYHRNMLAVMIEAFLSGRIVGAELSRGARNAGKSALAAGDVDPVVLAAELRVWHICPELTQGELDLRRSGAKHVGELNEDARGQLTRLALFLRSDRELEWPREYWDPYRSPASGADPGPAMLAMTSVACAVTSLFLFMAGSVWGGLACAAAGLGTFQWLRRLHRLPRRSESTPYGDASAFPFTSHEQAAEDAWLQEGLVGNAEVVGGVVG